MPKRNKEVLMQRVIEWLSHAYRAGITIGALSPLTERTILERVNTLFEYGECRRLDRVVVLPINRPEEAVRTFREYRTFMYSLDDLLTKRYDDALRHVLPGNHYNLFREAFLQEGRSKIFQLVRNAFHTFPGWPHRHLMDEEGTTSSDVYEEEHDLMQRAELSYLSLAFHAVGFTLVDPDIHVPVNAFVEYASEPFFPLCLPVGLHIPLPGSPPSVVVLAHAEPAN